MENQQFLSKVPFDKVIIIDKEGNSYEIIAHKIIINSGQQELHVENIPHPSVPEGITITCSTKYNVTSTQFEQLVIHPGASNVIHLAVEIKEKNVSRK